MWLTKQHHTQEQELPYISRVCPNWSRVFLRQPQAGGLGGHPVPLLPALSPPSSLCRSALSPVKALPGVLLHLGCACRQVPSPQSHRSTVFGFVSHHHRSFHPLFQAGTPSSTRLCPQTTVWLCGRWRSRCVAVLHPCDRSSERSFTDGGIVSSFNES